MLDLDNYSHNCFPWPIGVSWPWPRSYLRGQGHSAHIPKIRIWDKTPYCYVGSGNYFKQLLSMTQRKVCRDLDRRSYLQCQGQSAYNPKNQCPGHNSSLPCWIWIIFHTIVVHDSRVCHDLDPRSYLPRSRSQCTHTRNPYPGHHSLLSDLVVMILWTLNCCPWHRGCCCRGGGGVFVPLGHV